MGKIRDEQINQIEKGFETIQFKTFDSDGTYLSTEDENILFTSKDDLTPINMDLVKEYERPNKAVEHEIKLINQFIRNKNAHFILGSNNYTIGTPNSGKTAAVISDTNESIKALSGGKYFKTTDLDQSSVRNTAIKMDGSGFTVRQNKDLKISFNYYIDTNDSTDEFELAIRVGLRENSSAANYLKEYSFISNEWFDYNGVGETSMRFKKVETKTLNNWAKFTADVTAYNSDTDEIALIDSNGNGFAASDDVFIEVTIVKIRNIPRETQNNDFTAFYVDNFFIAEVNDFADDKLISVRTQEPANGTFTNTQTSDKHFLSNEASRTDYHIGQFSGLFERPRDSVAKSLEQIVQQEKINDYRFNLVRYNGTLRAKNTRYFMPHNKLWFNFDDPFTDPVSCVVDSMKYNLKAAEYTVQMHLPNQDDDVDSTYKVIFEQ